MDNNFIFSYFPDDFFNKNVNEPFIVFLMSKYMKNDIDDWKQGNPNEFIPDYVVNDHYYEFTLASNRCKNNLIRKLQKVTYESKNVIKDAWQCIQESLDSKMKKNYSVDDVSVCILCLLDFNEDKITDNGSMSAELFNLFHRDIYDSLQSDYISKGNFKNIYIIFPFSNETWWVMDIVKSNISSIQLSEAEIKSGNYPFFSRNMNYYELFNK